MRTERAGLGSARPFGAVDVLMKWGAVGLLGCSQIGRRGQHHGQPDVLGPELGRTSMALMAIRMIHVGGALNLLHRLRCILLLRTMLVDVVPDMERGPGFFVRAIRRNRRPDELGGQQKNQGEKQPTWHVSRQKGLALTNLDEHQESYRHHSTEFRRKDYILVMFMERSGE